KTFADQCIHDVGGDILNVTDTPIDTADDMITDVEPDGPVAAASHLDSQGKPNIPEAHDTDRSGPIVNQSQQVTQSGAHQDFPVSARWIDQTRQAHVRKCPAVSRPAADPQGQEVCPTTAGEKSPIKSAPQIHGTSWDDEYLTQLLRCHHGS